MANIGSGVLSGRFAPNEVLPREDELMATLGVSRTTMREAIKVLCAKGLLRTRQRIGVIVRPRQDWDLLDPAVLSWHPEISAERQLVAGLLEARRIFEPAAAELAAQRASLTDLTKIEDALRRMESAVAEDLQEVSDADLAFHRGVMDASGNVVLQRIGRTLEAVLGAAMMITNKVTDTPTLALEAHRDILDAIRMRDAEGARSAVNAMLDIAQKDLVFGTVPSDRTAQKSLGDLSKTKPGKRGRSILQ